MFFTLNPVRFFLVFFFTRQPLWLTLRLIIIALIDQSKNCVFITLRCFLIKWFKFIWFICKLFNTRYPVVLSNNKLNASLSCLVLFLNPNLPKLCDHIIFALISFKIIIKMLFNEKVICKLIILISCKI